mgnify:CR=1 FL=1
MVIGVLCISPLTAMASARAFFSSIAERVKPSAAGELRVKVVLGIGGEYHTEYPIYRKAQIAADSLFQFSSVLFGHHG